MRTVVTLAVPDAEEPLTLYAPSLRTNPWSAEVVRLLGGEAPEPLDLNGGAGEQPGAPGEELGREFGQDRGEHGIATPALAPGQLVEGADVAAQAGVRFLTHPVADVRAVGSGAG